MARTADDSWDPASGVGATATMVAAGRAMASADPRRLIDDPYAGPLVRAVGLDFFTRVLDGEVDLTSIADGSPERARAMIDGMAVRTKFFDDYLLAATGAGVRQVVILASGLDSRGYRLAWPAGTVVHEIDQPAVIEFKTRTLSRLGARPSAIHRTVPIDLREDWPKALRDSGFDAAQPTAWLAEGLLIYLPPDAQDRLFDQITAQSVPGGTVATEYVPGIVDFDAERARALSAPLREHGLDIDMPSLVYTGERSHVMEYLTGLGWRVTGAPRAELFDRYGLATAELEGTDPLGEIVYVSAEFDSRAGRSAR
jgi:methyltransferase (TIGR00027 family)